MRTFGMVLLLISLHTQGQSAQDVELNGRFKFFTTDRLGNLFTITEKNDIQKFDALGKKLSEANYKVLGEASFIDASNPMEIYVLYKDQNKLVYFDNMLNYRGETDLYKTLAVNNIQVVCRSYDNGIWFFDPDNYRLKKADKSGVLLTESVNLSALADTVLNPEILLDDGRNVYLKVASNKLMVFDILGNYIKSISLEHFKTFQVRNSEIIYSTENQLIRYQPETFVKVNVLEGLIDTLGEFNYSIRVEDKRIYIHHKEGIRIIDFQ